MVEDSAFARLTGWMKETSTQERANNESQKSRFSETFPDYEKRRESRYYKKFYMIRLTTSLIYKEMRNSRDYFDHAANTYVLK